MPETKAVIHHSTFETFFSNMPDKSMQIVPTDIPYNASETATSCKELGGFHNRSSFQLYFGEWDTGFNPLHLITEAHRTLEPGGWFITTNGDRLLGAVRDFASMDWSTLPAYLDFMHKHGILGKEQMEIAAAGLKEARHLPKMFDYKATITWHKTNPVTSVRKTTTVSSCEWIQVMRRCNDDGSPAKPVAWNWLGQNAMHNFISHPITANAHRLYWHVLNGVKDDLGNYIGGDIVPCHSSRKCNLCTDGIERRRHPTEKPAGIWKWIFDRYTEPGLKAYDPCAGVSSSGVAAIKAGMDWVGTEMMWEFATVSAMNLEGVWGVPPEPTGMIRMEMF